MRYKDKREQQYTDDICLEINGQKNLRRKLKKKKQFLRRPAKNKNTPRTIANSTDALPAKLW